MKIEEILAMANDNPKGMLEELRKGRSKDLPEIKKYIEAIDPLKHEVFNPTTRPDKIVKDDDGNTRTEKVTRLAVALQKLIVKRAAAFMFGNPVELLLKSDNPNQEKYFNVITRILEDVKINSINRKLARILFSCTEVAELWYPVEVENEDNLYGIGSKHKLKVMILNPMKGDVLYPYFDDYGDLIAFSREYAIKRGGEVKKYIETYTDSLIYKYETTEGEPVLIEGYPAKNTLKKIPIVYGSQDEADFEDVQIMIERFEKLISDFGDTNDYHASPTIFVKGVIKGFAKKGESGKIIEGDKDTTAEYLAWQNAPESVKLEIETLLRLIYTISQTPDISFESVKGLGSAISGKALKMMFLDAHLKVEDKNEIFDEYLKRRTSIIKSFLISINQSAKSEIQALKIENKVTPYMIDDEADQLDIIMTATGNKPVISQKTGIRMAGYSTNPDEEYDQIKKETQAESSIELFPTAE